MTDSSNDFPLSAPGNQSRHWWGSININRDTTKQIAKHKTKIMVKDKLSFDIDFDIDSDFTCMIIPFSLLMQHQLNQGRQAHTSMCATTAIAVNPMSP